MKNVYIIGTSCTTFGRLAERSFQDLAREAYLGALAENGGGVMGFDEAACAITILEKDG